MRLGRVGSWRGVAMTDVEYTAIYDRVADAWWFQDHSGYYLAYDGVFRSVRKDWDVYAPAYYETLEEAYAVLCDLSGGPPRRYGIIGPSGIRDVAGGVEV